MNNISKIICSDNNSALSSVSIKLVNSIINCSLFCVLDRVLKSEKQCTKY